MKYSYYIAILIFFCYSCNKEVDEKLVTAEKIVGQYPDSALWLLSAIDFPDKLPDRQKADYGWITAQAYYNLNSALKDDSLILFSLDYYKNNKCTDKLLSSYKFAIEYAFWNEKREKGLSLINEGLQTALTWNDSVEAAQFYFIKANVQPVEEAAISYCKIKEYDKNSEAKADYMTALLYANSGEVDSAKYYFEKSIETPLLKNYSAAIHYTRNYGNFLYAAKDTKGALREMQKVLEYDPDYSNPVLYSTLAFIYLKENKTDSAEYFLEIANDINNRRPDKDSPRFFSATNTIYTIRILLDYAQGKHINTNDLFGHMDSFVDEMYDGQSLFEEQQNLKDQLERRNLSLKIKHQHTQLLFTFLILLFALCGSIRYIYIPHKRRRLEEAEEKGEVLERMLKDASRSDTEHTQNLHFFKKILLQQLGLIRLVTTSPTAQKQALLQQMSSLTNEEISVDSLLIWEDLYPIIDSIYDHFYTQMHTKYKDILLEKEIQLCCLLCAEFSTKEISVVTQQSIRTIYQRKTTICQKLDIDEKEDIVEFY